MKRFMLILLTLALLIPATGLSEAVVLITDAASPAVSQLPSGTYQASMADGESLCGFSLVEMDGTGVLDTYVLDTSEPSTVVTMKEGQSIMMLMGCVSFLLLSESQAAAVKASDPYLLAIDGVDLHLAFSTAESVSKDSGEYPLLRSVGVDYDETLNTISITLFLLDDANADIAKSYAYDMVRLVNTCCIYQNTSIAPSKPKYLGGIYDLVNCNVTACRWVDMPDLTKAFVRHIIPVGTQGYGTIDAKYLD